MPWSGPTSGLIHRWPLDLASLSGSVDSDVIGSINITESGAVTNITGPTGIANTARLLDGATGVGAFASSPLPTTGAFTVSAWAYCTNPVDQTGGFFPTVLNLGSNGSSLNGLRYMTDDGSGGGSTGDIYAVTNPGSNQFVSVATPFLMTGWAQVGFTFDGASTNQIILNGAVTPLGSTVAGRSVGAGDFLGGTTAAAGLWPGGLAQVAVYNRVLNSAELIQLYNADAPSPVMPLTLAGQRMAFV